MKQGLKKIKKIRKERETFFFLVEMNNRGGG